jgi:hypothetical protein
MPPKAEKSVCPVCGRTLDCKSGTHGYVGHTVDATGRMRCKHGKYTSINSVHLFSGIDIDDETSNLSPVSKMMSTVTGDNECES